MKNRFVQKIASPVLLTAMVILIGTWMIFNIINLAEKESVATEPKDNIPPIIDEVPILPEPEVKIIVLIYPDDNYQIDGSPYLSEEIYKEKSRRLALMGDFDTAILSIMGAVPTKQEHFLSINVGIQSGAYNGTRKSSDTLDVELTKESLGIFTNEDPIDIKIDLMAPQLLATTRSEFIETRSVNKLVSLWNFISPNPPAASVNRILVAPFNKEGEFIGNIKSLSFDYTCSYANSCKVAVCEREELSTVCIEREFGWEAKQNWLKWFNSN